MISRIDLELLLIVIHGTMDENTTIHVLMCPMPCNEVIGGGCFNVWRREQGRNSIVTPVSRSNVLQAIE
jgi:hypothetical protein